MISTQFSRFVIHGLKMGDPWPHLLQYKDTTPLFDMRFAWWGKGISLIGHLMGAWGGCGWAWRLQLCRGLWLQLSGVDGVMICQVRSDPFPGKCRKIKTWVGYGFSNYAAECAWLVLSTGSVCSTPLSVFCFALAMLSGCLMSVLEFENVFLKCP